MTHPSPASGENGVALYYPYLTISDQGWLLGSLCLWDTVRRIVPDGLQVADPGWLMPLVSEGLVKRIDSHDYWADARSRLLAAITPTGHDAPANGEAARALLLTRFEALTPGSEDIVEIYKAKGDEETWEILIDAQLAERGESGYVRVARPVGELYMACLASAIAGRNSTPMITDEARYIDWTRRLGSAATNSTGEPLLAEVAALNLEWPDTGQFAATDSIKFYKWHCGTKAARSEFRTFLLRMRGERAATKSREQDEDVVERFKCELKAAHEEVLAKMAELGVKRRGSYLSIVASVTQPWAIPDKLLNIGRADAERRTALSQMHKNPAYYTYLVNETWT